MKHEEVVWQVAKKYDILDFYAIFDFVAVRFIHERVQKWRARPAGSAQYWLNLQDLRPDEERRRPLSTSYYILHI